jgi:hypothetical protein
LVEPSKEDDCTQEITTQKSWGGSHKCASDPWCPAPMHVSLLKLPAYHQTMQPHLLKAASCEAPDAELHSLAVKESLAAANLTSLLHPQPDPLLT